MNFSNNSRSAINIKAVLIVFGAIAMAGIGFSVVQLTLASPAAPNPGHTWSGIEKPSDCSSGQYVYGINGSTLDCRIPPGDITSVSSGVGTKGGGTSGAVTIEFDCSEVDGTGISCSGETLQLTDSTKSCSSGYAIRSFDLSSTGAPTCEAVGGDGGGTLSCYSYANTCSSATNCKSPYCPSGYAGVSCWGGIGETSASGMMSGPDPYSTSGRTFTRCQTSSGGSRYLWAGIVCCTIQ